MRVVVEGREYLAEPGSVVTIPRNAHHENANVTEDGGVLKVLFINVVCT
jgi:quercetin dioxygenase-like cupin family protein